MYSLVLMAALSGSATAPATWGCHGCWGCYGCYGGGCYGYRSCGCWGGYGCGCYGCGGYRVVYSSYGCHGCYGCSGCWNGHGAKPAQPPAGPGVGAPPNGPKPATPPAGGPQPPGDGAGAPPPTQPEVRRIGDVGMAPAYLIVNLPAEAKLTIDHEPTKATSASRRFVSPRLQRGRDFTYTLQAEIMRDGAPVTTTQQVVVRAGQTSEVTLEFPSTTLTQK